MCLFVGAAMFVGPTFVNDLWPWTMTPLVARIIGVWLTAIAAAFVWALWDGDAGRTRPIFMQGLPTAVLIGIVPLLHRDDLASAIGCFIPFALLVGTLAIAGLFAASRRQAARTDPLPRRPAGRRRAGAARP